MGERIIDEWVTAKRLPLNGACLYLFSKTITAVTKSEDDLLQPFLFANFSCPMLRWGTAYAGSRFLAHALQSSIAQRLGSHLLKQMPNGRFNRRSKACAHTVSAKLRISTGFRFRQGAKAPCGTPALHFALWLLTLLHNVIILKNYQMSIPYFKF